MANLSAKDDDFIRMLLQISGRARVSDFLAMRDGEALDILAQYQQAHPEMTLELSDGVLTQKAPAVHRESVSEQPSSMRPEVPEYTPPTQMPGSPMPPVEEPPPAAAPVAPPVFVAPTAPPEPPSMLRSPAEQPAAGIGSEPLLIAPGASAVDLPSAFDDQVGFEPVDPMSAVEPMSESEPGEQQPWLADADEAGSPAPLEYGSAALEYEPALSPGAPDEGTPPEEGYAVWPSEHVIVEDADTPLFDTPQIPAAATAAPDVVPAFAEAESSSIWDESADVPEFVMPAEHGDEEPPLSWFWWLMPILFTWAGGLAAWAVLRGQRPRAAKRLLIVGVVLTIPLVILLLVAIFALGASLPFVFASIAFNAIAG